MPESEHEYEIHFYGIHSSNVTPSDDMVKSNGVRNGDELFTFLARNDHIHPCEFISTGDRRNGSYIGMKALPSYPWKKPYSAYFDSEEEVKKAIVRILVPYVKQTPQQIEERIDYCDDVGWEE